MVMPWTSALGLSDHGWTSRSPLIATSRFSRSEAIRASGGRNQFQSKISRNRMTAATSSTTEMMPKWEEPRFGSFTCSGSICGR